MDHKVTHSEHTITVTYNGSIEPAHAADICREILKAMDVYPDRRMNIILDLTDGYLGSMKTIIEAGKYMIPTIKRFNNCYVINASGIKATFIKTLLKTINAIDQKVMFMDDVATAITHAESSWQSYQRDRSDK